MDASLEPHHRPMSLLGATLAFLASAALLLATSRALPMSWDEGNAILRAKHLAEGDWQYTVCREGHPAFYGVVIVAGHTLAEALRSDAWLAPLDAWPTPLDAWLAPLDAWRLGPILLFSLAVGAVFYRMRRLYTLAAAIAAAVSLLLLPRLFAHAHFASFDGPLTSCWMLTWAAFAPACRRQRWAWVRIAVWGIALGMTLSCKATGWIAPLPFIAWTLAYRDRAAAKAIAVGLPIAVATFLLLNPPLWPDPIGGIATFFNLNLHRGANPGLNISTWFLGHMYNLNHPLPWYNTIVWTGVTVPVGLLALSAIGFVTIMRRWRSDTAGVLLVANAMVLLIVRATPFAPPHDGVRLFLPSFAFIAALAGVGTGFLVEAARRRWSDRALMRRTAMAGLVAIFLGTATSLVWYAPQWLSYYNLLIGGLPGATAAGMEPTYYWDALDRTTLDWLDQHTSDTERVRFAAGSPENLHLMRQWGTLRCETRTNAPGRLRWYVVQRRPSAWQPADRRLLEQATPAYQKTLRAGGIGPWRLDVPLIQIFRYQDYEACAGKREAK